MFDVTWIRGLCLFHAILMGVDLKLFYEYIDLHYFMTLFCASQTIKPNRLPIRGRISTYGNTLFFSLTIFLFMNEKYAFYIR